jgi:hypothetical protein
MALGKGVCARLTILTVNLIFLLAGAAVMSFGIVILVDAQAIINIFLYIPGFPQTDWQYLINADQALNTSGIVLTVIGAVCLTISFLGLIGACIQHKSLLITYLVVNALTLLTELAWIIYVAVAINSVQGHFEDAMYQQLRIYFQPVVINGNEIILSSNEGALAWQKLQFEYDCCGAHGIEDYQDTWSGRNWRDGTQYNSSVIVPPSCCSQIIPSVIPNTTDEFINLQDCLYGRPTSGSYANTKNCYNALITTSTPMAYGVIALASMVALQVLVMLTTVYVLGQVTANENSVGTIF